MNGHTVGGHERQQELVRDSHVSLRGVKVRNEPAHGKKKSEKARGKVFSLTLEDMRKR
jgi:hypothetical protein